MIEQTGIGDVLAVGAGTAGSRIVSLLSKESLLVDRFAYVSCNPDDFSMAPLGEKVLIDCPVDQKLSPAIVRGLALDSRDRILAAFNGAKVIFVVAGLGSAVGSGLAPLVASIAQETGAVTIGVAIMPFEYEKKLKFNAGVSLRRLRAASRGVIVIDNDALLKSSPDDSLVDIYESANREAVKALASLLTKSSGSSVPVGLNKVLGTVLNDGYSLLGMSSSGSFDKAEEALAGAVVSISKTAAAKEADRAVVILTGNQSLSASEVGLAVKRLGSMMDNQAVDVEYGVRYSGVPQLQVSLLASGFKSTKYDDYDPLYKILAGKSIDDEMDCAIPAGLELLPSCE